MRLLVVLLVTGCTVAQVPTDRAPLSWHRHGRPEKLGTTVEGTTCGEQYMRAVAGVPEAEELMERCYRGTIAYGAGMLGFIVFPAAGITTGLFTDGTTSHVAYGAGFGMGAVSFLAGFAAAIWAAHREREAVDAYNRAIDTGVEQR